MCTLLEIEFVLHVARLRGPRDAAVGEPVYAAFGMYLVSFRCAVLASW